MSSLLCGSDKFNPNVAFSDDLAERAGLRGHDSLALPQVTIQEEAPRSVGPGEPRLFRSQRDWSSSMKPGAYD
jgi:hypothetical protein